MENIIELLKNTNARISLDDKWLVATDDEFFVYQRKRYSHYNTVLYQGDSFDEALKVLEESE